ncbi:lipopolysaccharide biosynthesis protein [Catenuloplanes atrovinosus]|uniref:O-antigen/teichoic acid export membrane protein n=1 Tax=Catenuloplanes atrovinosus TaxID=137266 RepID=A0AAE3YLA6_9ACTN|nr:lipopolysaccharide biosynthesis protein [Catenuloplanes atrovinosus]MDR7274607.1 O-antigen/teichoic acid export membrane protein [Catenuloplanes atrovinosus]
MVEQATEERPAAAPRMMRSGAASLAALVALGLTRLVHGALVARATEPETYGLVGSLVAVSTIASLLLPAGLASAASRFIPFQQGRGDQGAVGAVDRMLSRLGLAGAAVLGAGAGAVAAFVYDLGALDVLQVVLLCVTFCAYTVQKATLYAFGEVAHYAKLELASSVLAVGSTVAVVLAGVPLYLLPLALGYGLFGLAGWARLRRTRSEIRRGYGRGAVPDRREIWIYIALACVGTVCASGFLQGTQLLAGAFASREAVAYFAASVTLVAPFYFLPRALGMVLFPAMARAHGAGDAEAVRAQADISTRALLAALAPLFVGAILLAPEVLTIYGSGVYADGAPILRLMLAGTYLAVVPVAAVNSLSSGEHVRVPTLAAVAGASTGLVAVALLSGPFGATGVAGGYVLGTAITAGIPLVTAWRLLRMSWFGPVLRALSVVGSALVLAAVLDHLDVGAVLDVTAALLGAAIGASVLAGDLRKLWRDGRGRPATPGSGDAA